MAQVIPLRSLIEPAAQPVRQRLTKRLVESVKADPEREQLVWDTELKGFGLRVMPSCARSYFIQYRDTGRRTRKLVLGRHGVITAEQARARAKRHLADVAAGGNPSAARHKAREEAQAARSVADVVEAFLKYVSQRRKPSTAHSYRQVADQRILLPSLRKRRIDELTHDVVRAWHSAMSRTPTSANRALAILSAACSFARVSNPCTGVERYPERARDRFFTEVELKSLGATLAEGERTQTLLPGVVATVRLLALTGCRLSEILTLEWLHVDLETGVLRLADGKTGARNVPLSGAAVELLSKLPRAGRYVVLGTLPGERLNKWTLEHSWVRIRDKAKLTNARIHDLRHTIGTSAGALGLNAFTIRDLLGHRQVATTSRYVSAYTNPLRKAADQAVAPIAAALAAGEAGDVENVAPAEPSPAT